jgi:hypothetical protein
VKLAVAMMNTPFRCLSTQAGELVALSAYLDLDG